MKEASDPMLVVLRFIGEMEIAGYIKLQHRRQDNSNIWGERIIHITKKLKKLGIESEAAPVSAVVMPKIVGVDRTQTGVVVRNGINTPKNKKVSEIVKHMATETFTINNFVFDLLQKFPPKLEAGEEYMFGRTMTSARSLIHKNFRFPHFMDSRSRMYLSTTSGVTIQGSDFQKALVIPTYAEPLTDDGFLALQEAAAGYSEQKWSVVEMATHATYPEKTQDTWMTADKPYSYMACADLIRQYLDEPTKPLPAFIPLDGRCSGLQHWSAVSRSDAITAHLGMELEEADLDIYERVAADWAAVLPRDKLYLATRKAAKIPTMTWGYNATVMTSMAHIHKLFGAKSEWNVELEKYEIVGEGLPKADTAALGADLYKRLNETLAPLTAAVKWVSEAAVVISKDGNESIDWPTPDGFDCTQRKCKGIEVRLNCTLSSGKKLELTVRDFSGNIPNPAKHKSSIAPNVIHSLDATHLRMVARVLKKLGLPMAFIHDSFSTHCNYRKELYDAIVSTFIELYDMDYLSDLHKYWTVKYEVELDRPPEMGSWNPKTLEGLERFFL
jgi:DNA-directed RNA polymerase